MMKQGNFTLLSKQEFEDAMSEDYLLNLEMEVDADSLDSALLENFIKDHGDEFVLAADINKHCLVYHRGVGMDTKEGFFLMEKV